MNQIIKKSLRSLINDVDQYPILFTGEHTLVARFYHYLCLNMKDEYHRIHLEYYLKNDDELIIEATEDERKKAWYHCYQENYPSDNPPRIPKKNHVGKVGRYDIVILNHAGDGIDHAIEFKALSNDGFTPGSRHKLYEDLRILSEEILGRKRESTFFLYLHCNNIHKSKVKKVAELVQETYENAKVNNVLPHISTENYK